MKKILLLLLLLLSVIKLAFAQDFEKRTYVRLPITTTASDYFNSAHLNTCNINLGTEFYIKNRNSLVANFGIIKSYGSSGKGLFEIHALSTSGYKAQLEVRHYLSKNQFDFNNGFYIAAHAFFQRTNTIRDESVLDYIDDSPFPGTAHYKQSFYTVYRNVSAVSFKSGVQRIYPSGVMLGIAGGIGLQYITSESKNRKGSDRDYPHSQTDHGNKLFDHGNTFFPNVLFQITIGYSYCRRVKG